MQVIVKNLTNKIVQSEKKEASDKKKKSKVQKDKEINVKTGTKVITKGIKKGKKGQKGKKKKGKQAKK